MIRFTVLNKKEKDVWLPRLFDLFYRNMREITPGELSYEQEKQQWLSNVSPALDKEPRQIFLCFDGDVPAGYVQYYTNQKLLMVEEIQMEKSYQRTTLFYGICANLSNMLPEDIETVEAYAHKDNLYSRKLMTKLGMTQLDEEGPFVHLRGSAKLLRRYFK